MRLLLVGLSTAGFGEGDEDHGEFVLVDLAVVVHVTLPQQDVLELFYVVSVVVLDKE